MKVFDDVEENNTNQITIVPKSVSFTKDSISDDVERFIQAVEDGGEHDVLDVYTTATALIDYLTGIKKGVQKMVEDEVGKYEGEPAVSHGVKMVLSSTASTYDYSVHEEWVKQNKIVKTETDKLKKIQELMKKAEGTAGIIDEDTGEIVPGRVIKKFGSSVVRATIPKS